MRDPDNQLLINEFSVGETIISIDYIPEYDIPDYVLTEDKDYKKFINDVKYMCRGSRPYQKMIRFLRENLDMTQCSFYENITNANSNRIKIHIHHDPFTIEDIIVIVVRKREELMESMDIEQVAKEVMLLHYNLMVGLIPLSETAHELVHNHYLFVPTTNLLGNYKAFVEMYDRWIFPEQKDILRRIEEATTNYDLIKNQMSVLNKNYIYLNMEQYGLPRYDLIEQFVKDQLEANTRPIGLDINKPITAMTFTDNGNKAKAYLDDLNN